MSYYLYLHNISESAAAVEAFNALPGKVTDAIKNPGQLCLQNKFAHEQEACAQIDNWILAGSLTLYNRKVLKEKLDINEDVSDVHIALQAFLRWGEAFPEKLDGDFSLVIFRKDRESCFLARDIWGTRPLYYHKAANGIAFCNHPASLAALIKNKTLDIQYLADSITGIKSETDRTFQEEIKRVPPAHAGWWDGQQLSVYCYYSLQKSTPNHITDETQAIGKFRELLQKAVAKRCLSLSKVATELSGGLDSSTVTALAAQNTYTEAFSHRMRDEDLGKFIPYQDEREWAERLTTHAGIDSPIPILSTKYGIIQAIRDSYPHTGQIPQQNYYMLATLLYDTAAKKGHTVLLSGFGGDEMVTSSAGGHAKELVANGQWRSAWQFMRVNEQKSRTKTTKGLTRLFLDKMFPNAYHALQHHYAPHWSVARWPVFPITRDLCKDIKQHERYTAFHNPLRPFSLQHHQLTRITHNHVSQRLEYSWLAAAWHGLEYRYPLFDRELVEFYYHLPAELKRANGYGRYIFRKATKGILPQSLQWRTEKAGATIPDVFARVQMDKIQIEEYLKRFYNHQKAGKYIDFDKLLENFRILDKNPKSLNKKMPFAVLFNILKYLHYLEQKQ